MVFWWNMTSKTNSTKCLSQRNASQKRAQFYLKLFPKSAVNKYLRSTPPQIWDAKLYSNKVKGGTPTLATIVSVGRVFIKSHPPRRSGVWTATSSASWPPQSTLSPLGDQTTQQDSAEPISLIQPHPCVDTILLNASPSAAHTASWCKTQPAHTMAMSLENEPEGKC